MTAYSAILSGQIDAESYVDTVLAGQWSNNWIAAFEGDASASGHRLQTNALEQSGGSEAVTQACIRAANVGQTELKTNIGNVSSGIATNTALPGGLYGFYPQVKHSSSGGPNVYLQAAAATAPTSYSTNVGWNTPSGTQYAQQRYVQASPPYDLGNGEIPLFVFALIDNATGEVMATYIAEDPPWANNGPTVLNPLGRAGIAMPMSLNEAIADATKWVEYEHALASFVGLPRAEIESVLSLSKEPISQELKQRDMPLIPHPFDLSGLADVSVVLLDPVGSFCEQLQAIHCYTQDDLCEFLHGGHMIIDNQDNGAIAPPGVMPVNARFKK
jgi:hypothetical protein